jgi:hypothetical protein
MRVLLTENSPVGMLHLSSVDDVLTDFFRIGTYHDPLYELKDYLRLCLRPDYKDAVLVCNKTPWSELIWNDPDPLLGLFPDGATDKEKDMHEVKGLIYDMSGWKPDAIINIYDEKPSEKWRKRINALSVSDSSIIIVSLNASDPKFSKNIMEALRMLML